MTETVKKHGFKEIVARLADAMLPGRQTFEVQIGPGKVTVRDSSPLRYLPTIDTKRNLERARRSGILPLSISQILDQTQPSQIRNMVLFDSTPKSPGYDFRFTNLDPDQQVAELQLCSNQGNYDYVFIPRISVPLIIPLFTGISIHDYSLGNLPATLEQVSTVTSNRLLCHQVHHRSTRTFWSNSAGKLEPQKI